MIAFGNHMADVNSTPFRQHVQAGSLYISKNIKTIFQMISKQVYKHCKYGRLWPRSGMFKGFFLSCVMIFWSRFVTEWIVSSSLNRGANQFGGSNAFVNRLGDFECVLVTWLLSDFTFGTFTKAVSIPCGLKRDNRHNPWNTRSATWGGRWGTPSHTFGWGRRSGRTRRCRYSKPCPLQQGNRRTCRKIKMKFKSS